MEGRPLGNPSGTWDCPCERPVDDRTGSEPPPLAAPALPAVRLLGTPLLRPSMNNELPSTLLCNPQRRMALHGSARRTHGRKGIRAGFFVRMSCACNEGDLILLPVQRLNCSRASESCIQRHILGPGMSVRPILIRADVVDPFSCRTFTSCSATRRGSASLSLMNCPPPARAACRIRRPVVPNPEARKTPAQKTKTSIPQRGPPVSRNAPYPHPCRPAKPAPPRRPKANAHQQMW